MVPVGTNRYKDWGSGETCLPCACVRDNPSACFPAFGDVQLVGLSPWYFLVLSCRSDACFPGCPPPAGFLARFPAYLSDCLLACLAGCHSLPLIRCEEHDSACMPFVQGLVRRRLGILRSIGYIGRFLGAPPCLFPIPSYLGIPMLSNLSCKPYLPPSWGYPPAAEPSVVCWRRAKSGG